MISDSQLRELAEMSERIGSDPALVQGPGGNTSLKDDEELWVKASGFWLAEAAKAPSFVPISMAAVGEAIGDGVYDIPASAVIGERNAAGLRPSIETALHALMPHHVVIHAHALNAMATSILRNGREIAAAKLEGLAWDWIPYNRPGAPLARAVAQSIAAARPDILILQNHGIVVGADNIAEAEQLLKEAEKCLALPLRPIEKIPASFELQQDARFEVHARLSHVAMDADAFALLTRAVLVPDQVVFLGGPVPVLEPGESVADAEARVLAATGVEAKLFMTAGLGALVARERSDATEVMIDALAAIAERVPAGAPVTGLNTNDVADLLGWDAEHHRRALDAQRAGAL